MKAYKDGPIEQQNRYRTDVICCVLFSLLTVALMGIGILAFFKGNFNRLLVPYDPDGKGCGIDYPDYPFVFFASPHHDSLWITVCVSQCPKGGDTSLKCKPNSVVSSCFPKTSLNNNDSVSIYTTYPVAGRICVPYSKYLHQKISPALFTQNSQSRLSDVMNSWMIIVSSLAIAVVISCLFMVSMRMCSTFVVWLFILFSVGSLVALGVFCITPMSSVRKAYSSWEKYRVFSIVVGGLSFFIAFLTVLMACCYRRKITLGANIMKASSAFVSSEPWLYLLPVILFILTLIFTTFCIAVSLSVYSLSRPTPNSRTAYPFQHYYLPVHLKMLIGVLVVYFIWGLFFFGETCCFIVAGAATNWYFKLSHPMWLSCKRYLKFHMGSVVLGGFLTMMLGLLKHVYDILTPDTDETNTWLDRYRKCCGCMCYCCVKYLFRCFNSGAYMWMHLTSATYCSSVSEIIDLQIRNPASTSIVKLLTMIFSVLGNIAVAATTCAISYSILEDTPPYKDKVAQPLVPTFAIAFLAFAIGIFFLSLYSNAAEAIYLCYLAESDAGGDRNCPQQLREFLVQVKKQNYFG